MLAVHKNNQVSWVHEDPVTKSKKITDINGTVTSTVDLDPWGGETASSSNQAFQPHRFTTYERDDNDGDEAMMRRYTGKWHRFVQPDPYNGSYDFSNPQSFNRYAYVQNDPVNFIDPSGLLPVPCGPENHGVECGWASVSAGFFGWGDLNNRRRSRDWALEDKPPALQCPPGQICFLERVDDKRFKLLAFNPASDPPVRLPDVGPTRRNAEVIRKAYYASKYKNCVADANSDYDRQYDQLADEFMSKAYGIDTTSQATFWTRSLYEGLKAAKGLVGKAALKAAVAGATRSMPATALFNVAHAYAATLPALYVYSEAHERRLMGCASMWKK